MTMPLFDICCPACDTIRQDVWIRSDENPPACEKCGQPTHKHFGISHIEVFVPEFYEHIDTHPIWISSKKQLREETRKRGKTSDYAE